MARQESEATRAEPKAPAETVRDLSALRAFREVGRHGSIAAAAAALGTTQQALSARMRTLERVTGLHLLTRTPSGSHLTGQGKLVLGWAEEVLDAADRLEAGIRSIRAGVTHRLTIAASQTNAEHLVPHWLVGLRAAEAAQALTPTVVELLVGNSTAVMDHIRDGDAELGFIETPHLPADLVKRHVRDDELLVVVAPGHRWSRRRKPLTFPELAATPLVMREAGSGTRDTLTDYLADCDPPLTATPAIELGTSAAVRSAIAAGVAPGVLSRLAVRDDLVLGRLAAVEVDGPPLRRALTAIWRQELSPEGERLLAVASGIKPSPSLSGTDTYACSLSGLLYPSGIARPAVVFRAPDTMAIFVIGRAAGGRGPGQCCCFISAGGPSCGPIAGSNAAE